MERFNMHLSIVSTRVKFSHIFKCKLIFILYNIIHSLQSKTAAGADGAFYYIRQQKNLLIYF